MSREASRTQQARRDLLEIWSFIASDNEAAADRTLDRLGEVMRMLADRPFAGRARPELADNLRSFPVGNYVIFYRPVARGIDVIRVLSSYLDIAAEDFL